MIYTVDLREIKETGLWRGCGCGCRKRNSGCKQCSFPQNTQAEKESAAVSGFSSSTQFTLLGLLICDNTIFNNPVRQLSKHISVVQFNNNSIQFNSIQFNSIQFNSIHFNSTQLIQFDGKMLKFCSNRSTKQIHISIRTIHDWKSKYGMIPMISNNEEFIDSNDSHYTVLSPDNTQTLHRASALSDVNRINSICHNAMTGFKEWNQIPIVEKVKIYESVVKELHKNSKELIEAHKEIGIADWFAKFNVFGSIDNLNHYKSLLMTMNNGIIPVQHNNQHDLTMVLNQPIGPVLSISPWNAPGILTTRSILAPLTAGCSVIVKSSELSPLISYYIVKSFINGGLPKNVLHLIHSTKSDSEKIDQRYLLLPDRI
ncbi:unnamed protein product [[Candida] boidinii]|nr:unnamed protein product [[Candida] boidinii]